LSFFDGVGELLLFFVADLSTHTILIVDLVLQAVGEVLKTISGLDTFLNGLILLGKTLSFFNHALNFFLAKATLVVGDSDGFSLACSLVWG